MAITDWLVAIYTFANWDWSDFSGNNYNWTPSWAVTFWTDSFGKYAQFAWSCVNDVWTKARLIIWNVMNFTQVTDFSWCRTGKVETLWWVANWWLFWSSFDSTVEVSTSWVLRITLRWSTTVNITLVSSIVLWKVYSVWFKYVASETKIYAYINWVLLNLGGTLWPSTFLTNQRELGDNSFSNGSCWSATHYSYNAKIRNRALTDLEMKTVTSVWSWNSRISVDGTYSTRSINTLGFDTTWLVALYAKNNIDISGNGWNATLTWTTPTTNYFWEANSALHYNWTSDLMTTPNHGMTNIPGYTVFYMINPTTKLTRSRPLASNNLTTSYYWNAWWGGTDFVWYVWDWTSFSSWKAYLSFITFWSRQFVAITYDKVTGKLYKNWTLMQTQPFTSTTVTQQNLFVVWWSSTNYVDWDMYFVWIMQRAMSDVEINSLAKTLLGWLSQTKTGTFVNSIDTTTTDRTNILAEYLFAGNANDTSWNAINGTVTGATVTTNRHLVTGWYSFSGVSASDYIQLTSTPRDITTDVSYAIWFYANAITTQALWSKYNWTSTGDARLYILTWWKLRTIFRNATVSNELESKTTVAIGKWYDVIVTSNRTTGVVNMYVWWILESTNTQAVTMWINTSQFTLWANAWALTGNLNWKIEYFTARNRELTAVEAYKFYREKALAMGIKRWIAYFSSLSTI